MKNEDALRCTPTPMKRYYLWNPTHKTWSKQAMTLQAILALTGVTDDWLLTEMETNKLLTVAQARGSGERKPKLLPPEQSLLKTRLPVSSVCKATQETPPKSPARMEYKVLSLKDAFFGGRFDADALTYALNAHSRQGWHVQSCQMTSTSSENGEWHECLLVILQRRLRMAPR